jgi:hypothetical protein
MKLFKTRINTKAAFCEGYLTFFPRMEILNEMQELEVTNQQEIMGYFNTYKKLHLF